ncbi:MAG TPA: circularly permuted type 2 ATP-grasp protein [Candidatus Acidoferrales bacterium]|nr:circularly permuted type 2 ATP-grasp protein [Candidatus Acidoferrales bacterium]
MSDADNKKSNNDTPSMLQSQSMPNETAAKQKGAEAPVGLLAGYKRSASAFDEMLAENGQVRPHYTKLMETLEELSPAELRQRWDTSQRFVLEQGITYNVYGDPRGMERPWQLDPIPFVIAPDEWRILEAGLIQRAILLNRILVDCYGPQELIRSRWLSPALVFAQPDFLRPCHNLRMPDDVFLHFYAADLARSPDGRWWVVSDRTQIPTGAGYALASRLVTSRILPEVFRDNHVHRLAGFFQEVQHVLARLSPRKSDNPRVVLLTPGPHNETYFEQAYLARYLGYLLVEGQDLTVRDNSVFLKTLSGLDRVDVILRRVDDDFCDPLELRNDSMLGVPGLVEALRAGNVVVANALGSGLLQSPAFMAFLPGLCQHLLGEELKLPSAATWWCGQDSARQYVVENLDRLAIKPAFRSHIRIEDTGKPLSTSEREALRARIEFDPDLFVAQERVEWSTAPSWHGGRLTARPIGLRVFLVSSGDGGYSVMPGGLTRVSPDPSVFISMQHGGSSKDTWVTSEMPVEETTLLYASDHKVDLRRTGNNLPSRLADNFFWLGRYSERADETARLLRSTLRRFNPERTGSAMPLLGPLLLTLEKQGQLPGLLEKTELRQNPEAFEAELLAAIFDSARSGSLSHIVDHLQRLAMFVRDRTSNDMWRVLSRLNERLATPTTSLVLLAGDASGVLNETLLGLAAFHGLARENMTRAQAWRFLDIGLRLERAIYLSTLLDATLHSPKAEDPSVLEAVLEVADSSITFRSRYNLLPHLPAVFDLVLLDDKNPRSVLFQINQLARHFEHLPRDRESAAGSGKQILAECLARLNQTDARELAGPRENWTEGRLSQSIAETLNDLPRLSDAITANYFAHSAISRTGRGSEQ